MKMTNKLSSLIGSLIIAVAITLFLPATVNAKGHSSCNTGKNSHGSHGSYGKGSHGSHGSCGKGSHGSHGSYGKGSHGSHGSYGKGSHGSHGSYGNATTNCNDYKTLAYRYLNAYYRCYNYTYYQYYVYYIKKYNQCKADIPTTTNCDKYKDLAQRYLDAYNKCGNSCYYQYYVYYMEKYNNCQANTIQTGKVCGIVFEDSNDNGKFDKKTDKRLANIDVNITDSKGNVTTVTTNKNGYYCAKNIATGTATVDVVDPANSTHVIGLDPSEVNVIANKNNWAGRDGFTFNEPTGKVCGLVTVDGDGEANVTVNIIDEKGDVHTVITDADGKYCAQDIPEGTVTVDINESTLPDGVKRVLGENQDMYPVIGGENTDAGVDGYETLPGRTCGLVLLDSNGNSRFDSAEDKGIKGVVVEVTDAKGVVYRPTTNANGLWCVDALSKGNATIDIDEDTLPDGAKQVYGTEPNTVYIFADRYRAAGADGFTFSTQECSAGFTKLQMLVWTKGNNMSDNLQTTLPISLTDGNTIIFQDVQTGESNHIEQAFEQFKIIIVDNQKNLLASTGYTTDINNSTLEDEFSDLGYLDIADNAYELLLVHRADPIYGDDLENSNSVTFKGLCYKIQNTNG